MTTFILTHGAAMDTRAASHFIVQLLIKYRISFEDKNICVIANRAKLRSVAYRELLIHLKTLRLPLISIIRESKYYLDCAANGLNIFDPSKTDLSNLIADWQPITQWLHETEIKNRFKKKITLNTRNVSENSKPVLASQ